ncbi:hypothetical protein B5F40_01035 [Gordonibacter sp. An230]|uniref:PH domain-containing protein n=1 Tax=Gordonibacter sp. An230 TaxID=1965592 RepID=UPI000B3846C4|nr:PH domain-containing protein [Gordonibacter sp. An230]OUO92510.1 hypothetical protein B5F40_01035 [Gordonibacter sp. An230]
MTNAPQNFEPRQSQVTPRQADGQSPRQLVRHRVHHSYIWLGGIQTAFTALVVVLFAGGSSLAGALVDGDAPRAIDGMPGVLLVVVVSVLGFIALVGLVFLVQWWSYRHLYYELGDEELNFYSGIFNKKRVHVPYQRIQSVDQRATLPQRIFGVCTVSIDTAGGASNKAVQIPYMQKTRAEELRRELFARKQHAVAVAAGASASTGAPAAPVPGSAPAVAHGAPSVSGAPETGNVLDVPADIWDDVRGVFGGVFIDTGRVAYEYGLSNKELVLTGLSNNTAFLVVMIGLIGAFSQFVDGILPLFVGSSDQMMNSLVSTGVGLFGGNAVVAGIVVFVLASVVLWALSAIGTCVAYGGFRARRRDSRIEVERGLLQHQFQGVDIDRVQSVVVRQTLIRRLLGYCEVSLGKIDAAAEGQEGQQQGVKHQGIVVHPFVKLNRVPEILAGLVPEFADVPADNKPVARVALRRAFIRRCLIQGLGLWLAVFVAALQVVVHLMYAAHAFDDPFAFGVMNACAVVGYAFAFVLFVADVVGAVLWYRGSGFSYNRRFMQVSNGGLSRETVSFPRGKIQFGYTKTNPFQRIAGTATINVRTAAGIGGTTIRLIDATEDDARAWLEWMKPRGNVIQ